MSIKYKVIARGEPGVSGGGEQKYYASAISEKTVNLKDLSAEIERISTVSRIDIMGVLTALVELIPEKLINSTTVHLGELGYFRTSISSKGEPTETAVNANSIKGNKVLFRPGKDIKNILKSAEYTKVS